MTVSQFYDYALTVLAPTEPLFKLVPESKTDWKPTESSFTAGQLMDHIAYSLKFNANGIGKNQPCRSTVRTLGMLAGSTTVNPARAASRSACMNSAV